MDTILVMFDINNPDNGMDTGKASSFHFDELLGIEGGNITVRLVKQYKLKIGRRIFPIESYRSWVGNWCWDGARVTIKTANEIAAYLQSTGKFSCFEGVDGLYNAWCNYQPVDFGKVATP